MLPAIFAAKPILKVAVPVAIAVVLYASYIGWREYQQYVGREEERTKVQAELTVQAQESATQYARQVTILRQQVDQANQEKEEFRAELSKAHQEIQRYAKLNQVRRIDDDAIAIVNEFARVLNTQADQRVPDAGGAAEEPTVGAVAGPTTLDAFERLEELTARLGNCEVKHRGLSEWAVSNYNTEMEFYLRSPP